MAELAHTYTPSSDQVLRVAEARSSRVELAEFSISTWSTEVLILGLIMSTLQVLDGVLTAIGIGHFGTGAEGNALLRALMETVGAVPALVLVKGIAISIIFLLCSLASRVRWLPLAIKGMIGIYLFAAIIPWSYILFSKFVL